MIINTLGTSHGDPTYCRFNTSTLYEIGDRAYLFDAGEPVQALLIRRGFDFSHLKAVFITHMHADHVNGLVTLIKHIIKYPSKDQLVHVYFPDPKAKDAFLAWYELTNARYVELDSHIVFHTSQEGEIYDDGTLCVKALPTEHIAYDGGKPRSYSYILQGEGKRILHTGDLSGDFHDFPTVSYSEAFDVCVCEATHYSQENAYSKFEKSHFDRLLFIHIGNEWHGEGEEKLLKTNADLPYPVLIAHDGDAFEV